MQDVRVFAGEQPAIAPRLLETPHATKAINCRLDNGNVRGIPASVAVSPMPTLANNPQTLFLYAGTYWFSFSNYRDVVKSPIREDQYDRVYFSGGGIRPQYTRNDVATGGVNPLPAQTFTLGVPAPEQAPQLTYTADSSDDEPLDDETRYYVITYVTLLGEESGPSPISDKVVISHPETDAVTVSLPLLVSNTYQITHVNIYRSATGGDAADFFYVGQVAYGTPTFDDVAGTTLGVTLATENYAMPPEDLHGLTKINGGMLVGATGKTVCVSEPYLPYAWKSGNQLVAGDEVVAIAPLPNGAIVTTTGYPELLSGFTSDDMSLDRLELDQACVSARSVVDMGTRVIYASPDGLVSASVEGARLLTDGMLHPEQWQQLNPTSIHAYHHEGEYIGFYYVSDSDKGGFIFNPSRRDIRFLDTYASAGYRDLNSDNLYLVTDNTLVIYRASTQHTERYTWRSKVFDTAYSHYAMYRIKHKAGSDVTQTALTIITEDGELQTETLTGDDFGYIKPGLFKQWQIEIQSDQEIEAILLGNSLEELGV